MVPSTVEIFSSEVLQPCMRAFMKTTVWLHDTDKYRSDPLIGANMPSD